MTTHRDAPDPSVTAAATASSFAALGLIPDLLRAIADQGYEQPTPIQLKAIPLILQRRDVMGAAQTGTEKPQALRCRCCSSSPPGQYQPVTGAASDARLSTPTRESRRR